MFFEELKIEVTDKNTAKRAWEPKTKVERRSTPPSVINGELNLEWFREKYSWVLRRGADPSL